MKARILCAVAAALLVAGCGTKPTGTVPATMAPIGEVRDSRLGTQIGTSLSPDDLQAAKAAEYRALEYGRSDEEVRWQQGDGSDLRGTIELGRSYQVNRLDCRDYTNTLFIGGRPQVARGVACREPEGTWRIVS